jgi:hypothetical protein
VSEEPAGEQAAVEQMREAADAMVAGVERCLPGWVERQVLRILDAWGQADADARAEAEANAKSAGEIAAARISAELRVLFELDPSEQRSTPLEVVRTAVCEPTVILDAAGVPPVERDQFEERSFPGDLYGLVPHTFGDLGDDSLAPLHFVWGMAKATLLRARASAP